MLFRDTLYSPFLFKKKTKRLKVSLLLKVWATTCKKKKKKSNKWGTLLFFKSLSSDRGPYLEDLTSLTLKVVETSEGQLLAYQSRLCSHTFLLASTRWTLFAGHPTEINTSSFQDKNRLSSKWNGSPVTTSKAALSLHKVPLYCVVPCPHVGSVLTIPLTSALSFSNCSCSRS